MNRPPADESGRNFFHAIAALGQVKLATRNLASVPRKTVIGALTAKDRRGRTPLHHAAYAGHLRVLRAFAEVAPEAMNVRDQEGNSVRDALRRPQASAIGDPADLRYFQRLVTIDKMGCVFPEFPFGPADVWDVAVSNTSTAAIVQPTWTNGDRMLFVTGKESMTPVDLGKGNVPRFVANSNLHTLVLTEDKCFAWGKNVNGILGLDTDGKTVHNPEPLDECFVERTRALEKNAFSALGGSTKTEIKDPLVGVACCDFHSACCSTTKVWAWGANRGQMMGKVIKNTIVETPVVVFQSPTRIRSVSCTDNALAVLLSNGHVILLHNDKTTRLVLSKGKADGEAVVARGNFLAIQTTQGKLLRFAFSNLEDHITLWASRRPKDAILSFDISENGAAIVATKSGVYKIEDGRELSELTAARGIELTSLKTDSRFRSFVGVQRLVAGFGYGRDGPPVRERYPSIRSHVKWGTSDSVGGETQFSVQVGDTEVAVHKALVYARCPTLRPLMDDINSSAASMVAVPGGSAIFRRAKSGSGLTVENAAPKSVVAFVKSLRYASATIDDLGLEKDLEAGPELHEYLALARLITRDLGTGLWQARLAGIGCNVGIQGTTGAHLEVLSTASPVLAAQLERWGTEGILSDVPPFMLDLVLQFAYTMELNFSFVIDGTAQSKIQQIQILFELWELADELLMPCLSLACERRLFESLDFELVEPLLLATAGSADAPRFKLRSSLLDIFARYMGYFLPAFGALDTVTMDGVEAAMKVLEGSENADQDLAASYDALKALSQTAQPQAQKKKKASPITASPPGSVGVSSTLRPIAMAPAYATPSTRAVSPTGSENVATSLSNNDGGWIQARRKSRTSSQANQEKSGSMRSMLTPPASAASLSPSLSPSSSATTPFSAKSATPSASPSLNRKSATPLLPTLVSAGASGKSSPSSAVAALPQLGRPAKGVANSKLPDLPQLPTLGSQPTARSGSAGRTTRPKFNQKDRKRLQQFEDPFVLAQQLERNSAEAQSPTPWKQVTAASSQSVLERLERVHQINNKRPSSGSVWGI